MVRHARTIWKPDALTLSYSFTSSGQVGLTEINRVDADNDQGLVMRHLEMDMVLGLVHSATLTNAFGFIGQGGFFKWPADAATPTVSTLDFKNRGSVFGRFLWTVMGENANRKSKRVPSVRLKLGEALFSFVLTDSKQGAIDTLKVVGNHRWMETLA